MPLLQSRSIVNQSFITVQRYPVSKSVKHKHFATVLFLSAFTSLIVVVAALHARYVSDCTFLWLTLRFFFFIACLSVYNLFRYASAFFRISNGTGESFLYRDWCGWFFFRKKIDDALVPGVLETKREI